MILVTGWAKHQKIDQPNYKFLLPGEVVLPKSRPGLVAKASERSPNARGRFAERSPNVA
jgi:hypothetical protein